MESLPENPCRTLFVFINNIRKAVLWEDGRYQFAADTQMQTNILSKTDTVKVIHEEFYLEESSVNNILLFAQMRWRVEEDRGILKELERLDNKTNWNVIIVCDDCPISEHIPFNRIVQHGRYNNRMETRQLIDLVRNPNFNKLKYLKHVKIVDERMTHQYASMQALLWVYWKALLYSFTKLKSSPPPWSCIITIMIVLNIWSAFWKIMDWTTSTISARLTDIETFRRIACFQRCFLDLWHTKLTMFT